MPAKFQSSIILCPLFIGAVLIYPFAAYSEKEKTEVRDGYCVNTTSAHGLPQGKLYSLLTYKRVDEVRQLLSKSPTHAGDDQERAIWQASCLTVEQRFDDAAKIYDSVLTWENVPPLCIAKAAKAYLEIQNLEKATKLASLVIANFPIDEAFHTRVACYVVRGQNDLAISDYLAIANREKNYERVYLIKAANILAREGKYERALVLADKASHTSGGASSAAMWQTRGSCYKGQKRWNEAIDAFGKAIVLALPNPNSRENENVLSFSYRDRAVCYEKLGQLPKAKLDRQSLSDLGRSLEIDVMGER